MCIIGDYACIIALFIAHLNVSDSYKFANGSSRLRSPLGPLFSKHIDDMMFECAVYKDKLNFPANSHLVSALNSHQGKEAEVLLNKVAQEAEKAKIKTQLLKSNINRIKFPIVGRTTKPETKYLQKIYYLLEENNRALNENRLLESESETSNIRVLVQPRNITKIFDSPSVSKCVSIFPTILSSRSPLTPGQESTVVLHEDHKEFLVNEIRENNIFGIFVAFLNNHDHENKKSVFLQNATLCEFVDIEQLDETGRLVVRAIERFLIGNVITLSEAVIQAEVSLLRDSGTIRNPHMVEENARIIEKLYDRCNLLESEYRRLDNNPEDVKIIDSRLKFGEKLSNLIEHVDIERDRNLIYELTAFAGLEYHADVDTKMWAARSTDTEQRLEITIDVLKTKIEYLNNLIREKQSGNRAREEEVLPP